MYYSSCNQMKTFSSTFILIKLIELKMPISTEPYLKTFGSKKMLPPSGGGFKLNYRNLSIVPDVRFGFAPTQTTGEIV